VVVGFEFGNVLERDRVAIGERVLRGDGEEPPVASQTGPTVMPSRSRGRLKAITSSSRRCRDAIDGGMLDSEWVAQQLGRPVIKAFNHIFANSLREKGMPAGTKGRIALSVAGDPPDAKAVVLRLVDDLGFDPVDGGGLDDSWRQQPGTPAYCQDLGAAALRCALAEADRSRIAEYRAEEEARIRRSIAADARS
jgi:hypothetical protein